MSPALLIRHNRLMTRLKIIFLSDLMSLKWTMGILGLTMFLGLILANSGSHDYTLMHKILLTSQWATAFFMYGVARIILCIKPQQYILSALTSGIGLFLWSYVFLSIALLDLYPSTSAEWLLAIPLMCEVWIIAECLTKYKE